MAVAAHKNNGQCTVYLPTFQSRACADLESVSVGCIRNLGAEHLVRVRIYGDIKAQFTVMLRDIILEGVPV